MGYTLYIASIYPPPHHIHDKSFLLFLIKSIISAWLSIFEWISDSYTFFPYGRSNTKSHSTHFSFLMHMPRKLGKGEGEEKACYLYYILHEHDIRSFCAFPFSFHFLKLVSQVSVPVSQAQFIKSKSAVHACT